MILHIITLRHFTTKIALGGIDMSSEREKKELYKTIWAIADDLRGSVDGWDFKICFGDNVL